MTATSANGTGETIAAAWERAAPLLADWAQTWLVNRTDAWGGYNNVEDRAKIMTDGQELGATTTRPRKRDRGRVRLEKETLRRHFAARLPCQIVGLHSTSPENTSRWAGFDIDWHSPDSTAPAVNERASLGWYARLEGFGLKPLLYASNGQGGFHLWQIFSAPLPTADVFAFTEWLLADYAFYGMTARPEHFPKQASIPEGGYGNWQRLPGRHHTRPYWCAVWDGARWVEGEAAVEHILGITGDDGALVPWESIRAAQAAAASPTQTRTPHRGPSVFSIHAGDALEVRVLAYMARLPNLGEGQGRDDVAYNFAAFLVRDLALPDDRALNYLEQWDGGNTPPKGRDRLAEIIASAHQYGRHAYGSGLNGTNGHAPRSNGHGRHEEVARNAPPGEPSSADTDAMKAESSVFKLGTLTIIPGTARRTPSGVIRVQLKVYKGNALVADFVLSGSPSSWKANARLLAQIIADEEAPPAAPSFEETEKLFREVIAAAGRRADATLRPEGPTLASIVRTTVPAMWRLVCRTERGAWSESKPGEVSQSEFTRYVPEELMEECGKAVDAPTSDDKPDRQKLLQAIQAELLILWATQLRTLPAQADVDLGKDTAAGARFHEDMVRLWSVPKTWEVPKGEDGTPDQHIGVTRASLVSRVTAQRKEAVRKAGATEETPLLGNQWKRWQRIHPALSAWWRLALVGGEIRPFLAMRWELCNQVPQELIGVSSQTSLTRLGWQYGVLQKNPPVPSSLSGGTDRLAVLSNSLTDELFSIPEERLDNGEDCPGPDYTVPPAANPNT